VGNRGGGREALVALATRGGGSSGGGRPGDFLHTSEES
jgi:hypothetical protein